MQPNGVLVYMSLRSRACAFHRDNLCRQFVPTTDVRVEDFRLPLRVRL
jgi:hypothetical protein